ncbi:hypothetical protein Dsin_028521 [Dipteronia sinensis]|uniref:Uncharacterized protein n=1 Tax=Dipteronia sinensis TaxID=43782 RepID=A0AAD9ZRG2_9ROSI|nr:hypothetical protein Dsin_028521 [Dipteronia sinensis]
MGSKEATQDMGAKFSRHEANSVPQQQQCATGSEPLSQDTRIVREMKIKSDDTDDMKALAPPAEAKKLPHNYQAILKDADEDFDVDKYSSLPMELLYKRLEDGVFLHKKRQKYLVDKECGSNSFILYARQLSIIWGEDTRYWRWYSVKETSDADVEVAELKNVCWLEIHANFDTTNLTPGALYQVAFVIKMGESCYGWDHPVNVRLRLPNGTVKQHKQNFRLKPKNEWINIPVDEFTLTPQNTGEIEISMEEYKGGNWKSGLHIKAVTIQPKKHHNI